jgi:hypothetical protein
MGGATWVNENFALHNVHVCEVCVGSNKENLCIPEMVANMGIWR